MNTPKTTTTKKRRRTCECGKDDTCKTHSKYKMQIIMHDQFKSMHAPTVIWYSFLQHQNKPADAVYDGMKDRIRKYFGIHAKLIVFYHNNSEPNNEITREVL